MRRWAPLTALAVLWLALSPLRPAPAAEPSPYRIGVGDILAVSVWDHKDLDQEVFVRPDGKISLPLLGEVHVAGRTIAELSEQLAELYSRTVRNAQVMIGVREIRSRTVFFVGGVGKPGPMQLVHDLTLLQALAMVGGALPDANPEAAFVKRGDEKIPVNLTGLQQGDLSGDVRLQPGDTVVVPMATVVYVQGEVNSPGKVRYSSNLTIVSAIVQSGGFTPDAAAKRVTLIRSVGLSKTNDSVNVQSITEEGAPDVLLQPNDIIVVPKRTRFETHRPRIAPGSTARLAAAPRWPCGEHPLCAIVRHAYRCQPESTVSMTRTRA